LSFQVSKLTKDILEQREPELEVDPLDISSGFQKINDSPSSLGKHSGHSEIDPSITSTTSSRLIGNKKKPLNVITVYVIIQLML
jgi:hypothetical protein